MITQDELKRRLRYDAEAGDFIWIEPGYNKSRLLGKVAGSRDPDGYLQIKLCGRSYRAHHLAWLYVHGVMPTASLDHRDGIRDNNAIANLREVTCAGNSQNQRKAHADSGVGLIGVDYNHTKKRYRARLQAGGKRVDLGGFATAEEAHQAYLIAKRAFHETCTI